MLKIGKLQQRLEPAVKQLTHFCVKMIKGNKHCTDKVPLDI